MNLRWQISSLRGPERADFRPEIADFRPERIWGGTYERKITNEQMKIWTNKSPRVLQDFVPYGAAALLPLTPIHNYAKQGNGYR